MLLFHHWLVYAWIVPLAWAFAALVDVFMIEWDIYENPLQATALSGLVVALPLLVFSLPGAQLDFQNWNIVIAGFCSGLFYALHLMFYYQAMFIANDATHAETFINTEVVLVPILAFIVLGETLAATNYLGIFLSALGVIILGWGARAHVVGHRRLAMFLACAVFASSIAFVLEDILFDLTDYRTGLFFYAIGVLVAAIPLALQQGAIVTSLRLIRYFRFIATAEIFTLIATMASLRAIETGPSVSLVTVIETARPVLIMVLCFALWVFFRSYCAIELNTMLALRNQFYAAKSKLAACTFIALGVYLVSFY